MTTDSELRRLAAHGDPLARHTLTRRLNRPFQLSRDGAAAAAELVEALGPDGARLWLDQVRDELEATR